MKEFIPIPGTVKSRLIEIALQEFEKLGYEGVNVVILAKMAGVTTGSIYHHFGSKLELHRTIREEMEKRVVDRMEGAAAVSENTRDSIRAAMLVGFDAAIHFNVCRLISESDPSDRSDVVELFLSKVTDGEIKGIETILAAAWRAALTSVVNGLPQKEARKSLEWFLK
jgi:AcrR family transcriptional regulator